MPECSMIKVLVQRQANEQIPTTVYAHALPILAEIHGEENLVVSKDPPLAVRNLRMSSEYSRLQSQFGRKPETSITWVEAVYGPASAGRLLEAMKNDMKTVDNMLYDELHPEDLDDEPLAVPQIQPGSYAWVKDKLKLYGIDFVHNAKKVALEQLLRTEIEMRLGGKMELDADMPIEELNLILEAKTPQD